MEIRYEVHENALQTTLGYQGLELQEWLNAQAGRLDPVGDFARAMHILRNRNTRLTDAQKARYRALGRLVRREWKGGGAP